MKRNIYITTAIMLALSGCSLKPELVMPKTELPSEYRADATKSVAINKNWWQSYGDATLSKLMDEAFAHNFDLQKAMVNISLARAQLSLSESERYPSLDAKGSFGRVRSSADTISSRSHTEFNSFSLSAILSYELDLWGRVKDGEEAAKDTLLATEASRDAVKLALAAGVADSYFALISLHEQQRIIDETIASRKESVARMEQKYALGAINRAVLLQEKAELSGLMMNKDSLNEAITLQCSALAVLVGRTPEQIVALSKEQMRSSLPNDIEVPSGLPSELLEKRPDIKEAELRLKAANAQVGVAKTAYFPTISLSGVLGFESKQLSNLLSSEANTWNIGGGLVAPILNHGRTKAGVQSAEALKEMAVINYAQSVQKAFAEVYDALNRRHILVQKLEHNKEHEKNFEEVLKLVQTQYEGGYNEYLNVLDAKRHLLTAQLATVQTKQALLSTNVSLYKALGGGWEKGAY